MTSRPHPSRRPLTTRFAFARRKLSRLAAFRQHTDEEQGSVRQPSKFSLLIIVALTAIGMVAAISAIQLLEAVLG